MTTYELNSTDDTDTNPGNKTSVLLEIKHISVDYYAASGNVHAFDACPANLPLLLPPATNMPSRRVACHLYDPRFNAGKLPIGAEFAANYEEKYEAIQKERSVNGQ